MTLAACVPQSGAAIAWFRFGAGLVRAGSSLRKFGVSGILLDLTHAMAAGGQLMFASDTHNYALQVLSQMTTLPGMWRALYPSGYRIDIRCSTDFVSITRKSCRGQIVRDNE